MILLDSSGWIEIFTKGSLEEKFKHQLTLADSWVASTVNLYEVYRKITQTSEIQALNAVFYIRRGGLIIEPSDGICLTAADLSIETGLGMADAIILATARSEKVKLYTKDSDFLPFADCVVVK